MHACMHNAHCLRLALHIGQFAPTYYLCTFQNPSLEKIVQNSKRRLKWLSSKCLAAKATAYQREDGVLSLHPQRGHQPINRTREHSMEKEVSRRGSFTLFRYMPGVCIKGTWIFILLYPITRSP